MRASLAALRGSSGAVTATARAPVPPFGGGRTQGVRTPHVRPRHRCSQPHDSGEREVGSGEVSGAPRGVAGPSRTHRGIHHRTPAGDTNTPPRRQRTPSVTARSLQARQAIAAKRRAQNLDFAVIFSSAYRRIGAEPDRRPQHLHRRKPPQAHQKPTVRPRNERSRPRGATNRRTGPETAFLSV